MAAAIPLALVLLVSSAAMGVAFGEDDTMKICHKPGTSAEKTMEIPTRAWSGHAQHGDHEGACRAPGAASAPWRGAPSTSLAIHQDADGHVDGTAVFKVRVTNTGDATAHDLGVSGRLQGDGQWRIRAHGLDCTVAYGELRCDPIELPPGGTASLRLDYDVGLTLCENVRTTFWAGASNAPEPDVASRSTVRVGPCGAADDRPADVVFGL